MPMATSRIDSLITMPITALRHDAANRGRFTREPAAPVRVADDGDGINDALAQAQAAIVMGTGTAVAMGTAGVTLVKDDLPGIVRACRLAARRWRRSRSSRACSSRSSTTPSACRWAAGVLYPFSGMLLSPMVAAATMSFSSVSVIANALRLRDARI
jgi:P-type Cu+ transporter